MKCTSCEKETSDGIEFECSNCKEKNFRCAKCRNLSNEYECKCGRQGP